MSSPEHIHTVFVERKLPAAQALHDAKIAQGLFETLRFAELLGVLAYNTQHLEDGDTSFEAPIALGETDTSTLIGHKMIMADRKQIRYPDLGFQEWPISRLTPLGIVAVNMYALDEAKLSRGFIAPYLREPFADMNILDEPAASDDVLPKVS